MKRQAVFRVDASLSIGTGHVMRCLILADALGQEGFESLFICRELEGNLTEYIESRGYAVFGIPDSEPLLRNNVVRDACHTIELMASLDDQVAWLFVDHYEIDTYWESLVKPHAEKLIIIDDLADRPHLADVLVDQNAFENGEQRYADLVPESCRQLLGPQYLLLRPSFYTERSNLRMRSGKLDRLLIFFGGTDPTGETIKALHALDHAFNNGIFHVDVVVGQANSRLAEIQRKSLEIPGSHLHIQIENIAEIITAADFALGSGGVAMWERCYLGLPSAVTMVADNQRESVNFAHKCGAAWMLGSHEQINTAHYADILHRALSSPIDLIEMGRKALQLMGSRIETNNNRVIAALMEEQS